MIKSNIWTDVIGVVASIACAIHCAAMPFIVGFLPAMGLSFLADDSFHKVMVGVCSLLAASAFIPGLRRHGRLLPIVVASVGLGMISIAMIRHLASPMTSAAVINSFFLIASV